MVVLMLAAGSWWVRQQLYVNIRKRRTLPVQSLANPAKNHARTVQFHDVHIALAARFGQRSLLAVHKA